MTGAQLAGTLIAATLLVLGFASILASLLQPRRSTRVLLAFGLSIGLYGVRLLAEQGAVRMAIPATDTAWRYLIACVTYVVNIPLVVFVRDIIGPGWHNSMQWVSRGVTAFAVAALAADIVLRPGASIPANSWLVLTLIAAALANLFHTSRTHQRRTVFTDRIVMGGAATFTVFAINENVGRVVFPRTNVEPIGMLVFVLSVGYAVVREVLRAEAEFAGIQRELETARRIQLSLLPRRIPQHASLQIAVRFAPVTAVAGDIYDVVQLDADCIGIFVADVSGHGIPAALVASMVKVAFSAQADHASNPAVVLTSMNEVLCRHLEHAYVTAVYAVLNARRQTITMANAGHPPALVRRGSETVIQREHGVMLGVFPDARYANSEIAGFAAGDRLLLYSDGVVEARDRAGEFFDPERVARWLSEIPHISAEQFADAAFSELTRWTGGLFEDDVTFAIAERVE